MMARMQLADWAVSAAVPKTKRNLLFVCLLAIQIVLIPLVLWLVSPHIGSRAAARAAARGAAPVDTVAFPPALPERSQGPTEAPTAIPPSGTTANAAPAVMAVVPPPAPIAWPSPTFAETAAPAPIEAALTPAAPAATPAPVPATTTETAVPAARVKSVLVMTTAYCPCTICCGGSAKGITSTNRDVNVHPRGIAVDPALIPYFTVLTVPGYGTATVDDTGSAMRRDATRGIVHLDLRFRTHTQAKAWGVRWMRINLQEDAPAAMMSTAATDGGDTDEGAVVDLH